MSRGVRIWRTVDGRYVGDGHLDAAFLAAGIDDPVPADFDEADFEPGPAVAAGDDVVVDEDLSALTKPKLIQWLTDHGVDHDPKATKPELLALAEAAAAAGEPVPAGDAGHPSGVTVITS